jgi:hypothetical protein
MLCGPVLILHLALIDIVIGDRDSIKESPTPPSMREMPVEGLQPTGIMTGIFVVQR